MSKPLRRWPLALAALAALALALGAALVWWRAAGGRLPWAREDLWAALQRRGALRVCLDASYPPFEDVNAQGQFEGLDVDLARLLAERWGLEAQFVNIHFDGLYDALLAERCDLVLSALPYDRTMTRDVLYSQSYFNAGQVLLAPAEDEAVGRIEDLVGRRVAVELGGEGHHWLREWNRYRPGEIEIVPLRELPDLAEALRSGQAEAALCDHVAALRLMQAAPLRVVEPPLTDAPLVAATRRSGARLVAELNLALEAWRADGTLERLRARWFSPQPGE